MTREGTQATKKDVLLSVLDTLVDERPKTFADCVAWARRRFQVLFDNKIRFVAQRHVALC